jgi:hypothetical protein
MAEVFHKIITRVAERGRKECGKEPEGVDRSAHGLHGERSTKMGLKQWVLTGWVRAGWLAEWMSDQMGA